MNELYKTTDIILAACLRLNGADMMSIEKDGNKVSGKSIMGLMTIEGYSGSILQVSTSGSDAQDAMAEIEELFDNKFYED